MKIRIAVSMIVAIGIALYVGFPEKLREGIDRPVSAQVGGGCGSFSPQQIPCGDNESCGLGFYTVTAAFYDGPGLFGNEPRDIPCAGTTCGTIPNVQTTYLNNWCCDQDGDFVTSVACGGNDCNDNNAAIRPGATEVCDGIDNNCNSQVDEGFDLDNDGFTTCAGDCDDSNANVNPNATEACDGIDNNCDLEVDEGCPCAQYGVGWFIGNDGLTCVPPECAYCYSAGGTHCPPCWTPILIDISGNGFSMTNGANGVLFKPAPGRDPIRTAWTSSGTDDAWLVLDRNDSGMIDDASELFSCAAPQPQPLPGQIGNGFIALAEFDKPENGGNGDSRIDRQDAVFARLQLWTDRNKNGVSERREMELLSLSEVRVIELEYQESRRVDQHGNKFKYRAIVRDKRGAQVGRWAYDVFPVVQY
jgi:hypothetical protein